MSPGPIDDPRLIAVAVLAGAAGVLVLMAALRKTRRLAFGIALAATIALIWALLRR